MSVDVLIFLLVLLTGCYISTSTAHSQCRLRDGECTYTVNLAAPTSCSPAAPNVDNYIEDSVKPEALRQPSNAMVHQLQTDLSTMKSDHENRIKELEASIQRVMRNALLPGPAVQEDYEESNREARTLTLDNHTPDRPGNLLLFQLQSQFNRMSTSLGERTADLLEARNKLNETTDLLTAAQKQALEVSSKLSHLETKSSVLEREANILKNKLKDKTERLEYANERLNISDARLLETETQLYDVVRAESNVREELETLKIILNKTQAQLAALQRNHSELTTKYRRAKRTLILREEELMECYSGKCLIYNTCV